ncbi:MAG: two-component regulator propeller domain-containing protein, partial [Spirochaetaceae bacterium]
PENADSISDNTVRDIHEDPAGRLWIATYDGLNMYHGEDNRFTAYRAECEFTMALGQSRNGHLWVGTWGGAGLYNFDIDSKSFTAHPLPDERAYSLETNGNGSLLVGTWGGGLVEVDAHSGKVTSRHTSTKDDCLLPLQGQSGNSLGRHKRRGHKQNGGSGKRVYLLRQ